MTARLEAEMDSHHEKLMAITKAGQGKIETMWKACLEKSEATDLEVVAVNQEVSNEETAVETV
jgi:hypothetical protein